MQSKTRILIIFIALCLLVGVVYIISLLAHHPHTPGIQEPNIYQDSENHPLSTYTFNNVVVSSYYSMGIYIVSTHLISNPETEQVVLRLTDEDLQGYIPELVFNSDPTLESFAFVYFDLAHPESDMGNFSTTAQLFKINPNTGEALRGARIVDLPISWFSESDEPMRILSGTNLSLDTNVLSFNSFSGFEGNFINGVPDAQKIPKTVTFHDELVFPLLVTRKHIVTIYPYNEDQEVEDELSIEYMDGNADTVSLSMQTVSGNGHICALENAEFTVDPKNHHVYTYYDNTAQSTPPLVMNIIDGKIVFHDSPGNYYYNTLCGVHGRIEGTAFQLPDWLVSTAPHK